jgi:hypothetical protein
MGKQKQGLPLHMDRDLSPPLFKALDGLERGSKELSQFLLSLSQIRSYFGEFGIVHVLHPS